MNRNYSPGPINVAGAFTGEFSSGNALSMDEAPYVIERDRINEGKLPGFNRKLLPTFMGQESGDRTAGGYYLLDTYERAKFVYDWYQDPVDGYVLDGIPILQREYFLNPLAHVWHVVGAHDFKNIDTSQKIVRFQRWQCERADLFSVLASCWSSLRDVAKECDLAAIWLLVNPEQVENVGLVSVSDSSQVITQPNYKAINMLRSLSRVGSILSSEISSEPCFDRTSWIFSIWFPYQAGAINKTTLWPNSPPFPRL